MVDREKKLENVIKQMLTPIKNIPLDLIINSISECDVLMFDRTNKNHTKLLENIQKGVVKAIQTINKDGIESKRVNEVGNYIEPYLKEALTDIEDGYRADTPIAKNGKRISAGYPDIQLSYGEEVCYIECKTFNISSINTEYRSFYLSPSKNFKITKTGIHFIVSFEIEKKESKVEKKEPELYKVSSWKILDAYHLDCDVKYEFNSDNRRMYNKKMVLLEGKV